MYTIYKMHRRIGAPLEFHGLKAQYIFYAGGLVVADMLLFAILYIVHVNNYVCLVLCFGIGAFGIVGIYRLSHRYGQYGWRRRQASRSVPKAVRSGTRQVYLQLKK